MTSIDLFKVEEISLKYTPSITPSQRPIINCSRDAYEVLKSSWSKDMFLREEFNILLLDNKNHVLGICNLFKGGIASTIVDLRLAFASALLANSSAIILAHNHPSCTLKPSQHDIQLTKKFKEAGKFLDIAIHDHIIVTPDDHYYSFADEQLHF